MIASVENGGRDKNGRFAKGNTNTLGLIHFDGKIKTQEFRTCILNFLDSISDEQVSEYFSLVPDTQKFQVYATLVDLSQKWKNQDRKIDLELLKLQLNDLEDDKDITIDVEFKE